MPSIDLTGCANCLTEGQKQVVIINLLLEILQKLDPMADTDIQTYIEGCANCLHEGQKQTVITNILSTINDTISAFTEGCPTLIGLVSPEGAETGTCENQCYVQWNGTDTILRVWYFTGTVGTNTGWI